ncbi:MAG TPA: hypothetical protein PLL66_01200 [Bacteroidales bacterium]|nr:hypothetical protein [Bacteroidales bacterium]
MKKAFLIVLFLLTFVGITNAQIKDSSINMLKCEVNYSFQMPFGDMADRFGLSSTIGFGLDYQLKSGWTIGTEFNYLFGGNIKDSTSILTGLMTESGYIINEYGEYGTFLLSERGFYGGAKIGKLIPVWGPNKNSGIIVNVGAGLLQHHIRIENKDNNTPPILGDYKKGYDRLSNGLSLREFIGYQYLDNNGTINFYFGFEFYQAWTQCRRDYNFDTMQSDNTERKDYLSGFRIGWILPLYKKAPNKYYYY